MAEPVNALAAYLSPEQRRRIGNALMAGQYDRATPEEGNVSQRHGLLPLATYDNGRTGIAFPGIVAEPVESFNRLLQNGYTSGDAKGVEDAFNVAGAAMMGGLAAPRPRGSLGTVSREQPAGIRAYHGTQDASFSTFDPAKIGSSMGAEDARVAPAFFFDTSPRGTDPYIATHYDKANTVPNPLAVSNYFRVGNGSATIPVELRLRNPYVSNHRVEPYPDHSGEIMKDAFSKGHDAVVFNMREGIEGGPASIVAVSANNGKGTVYSPLTGDLLYANGGKQGAATGAAVNALNEHPGIRAYHGSPHDFDRFDMSKIGTGEGAQAYGHGLYFAENEGVAKSYRDNLADYKDAVRWKGSEPPNPAQKKLMAMLSGPDVVRGEAMTLDALDRDLYQTIMRAQRMEGSPAEAQFKRMADEARVLRAELKNSAQNFDVKPPGRMYEVNIKANPDDFLDWDKPLSQQSEKVREAITPLAQAKASRLPPDMRDIRNWPITNFINTDDRSANILREAGIPGIRYLDQGSRGAGEGSRNYVVFDDSLIEILRKYGLLGMAGGAATNELLQYLQPDRPASPKYLPGDA